MRRQVILLAVAVILLFASVLSAAALASDGPNISWWLIGGGPPVSAAAVRLSGGVGQGVAGLVGSQGINVCSGFWCAPAASWTYYGLFLPLVNK
jgi:hypothetical protein